MKKIVLSICCVLAELVMNAQVPTPSYQWAERMGGTSDDFGLSIATDVSGNVYTTGFFQSYPADLDPNPTSNLDFYANGSDDVFITKTDAAGNLAWSVGIGSYNSDKGFSIGVDGLGNVYVSGWFQETVDFDPGSGTTNLTSAGGTDAFVLKLDASGNFLWAARFGGTSNDQARGLDVDNSGNVYVTGKFSGIVDFDPGVGTSTVTAIGNSDAFAVKLNTSGNLVWVKTWGGTSASLVGSAIDTDNSGNVYINGDFSGVADMDPGVGTMTLSSVASSTDIFISKLDASGIFVWSKNIISGPGEDYSTSFKVDPSGNSYTTGQFTGTVSADPASTGTVSLATIGTDYDVFISKINTSGNLVWAKSFGGTSDDVGRGVALNGSGNIFITGGFGDDVDFDPSATATHTLNSNGSSDIFILELNATGNYVWARSIGDVGYDDAYYLTADTISGNIFVTGTFKNSPDFNTGSGINTLTADMDWFGASNDIFMLKLSPCVVPLAPTSVTPIANLKLCTNHSTTLTATSTATINWFTTSTSTVSVGTGTIYITPTLSTGSYTYYAESSTCSPSDERTAFTLTVNPMPVVTSNSGVICAGQSFTIIPTGASTYIYSGGSNIVSPTSSTFYSVIGKDANGCSSLPSVSEVTVNVSPSMTIASTKTVLCVGETATLSTTGAVTYTWNNTSNSNSIVVSPTVSTLYTVIGTGPNGCTSSISYTQTVSPCTSVEELSSSTLLSIYPNPSNGEFTIESEEATFITIYDALGKVILSRQLEEGKHQVQLKNEPNGLYLLRALVKGKEQSIRLIKQ